MEKNKINVAGVVKALKIIKRFCKETGYCRNCLQTLWDICNTCVGYCEKKQFYPPRRWLITEDYYNARNKQRTNKGETNGRK